MESREARLVSANRARGEADDDRTEEWEELQEEIDIEAEGWSKRVDSTVPDVEEDRCCQVFIFALLYLLSGCKLTGQMIRSLANEVEELKKMVANLEAPAPEVSIGPAIEGVVEGGGVFLPGDSDHGNEPAA